MADPISWAFLLLEGYQVYKGLQFGVKLADAAAKDAAKARAKAIRERGMDQVDLCNLLSDFLEVNFDDDKDGHLAQGEVVNGIHKLQEMVQEATSKQMRQCAMDYLSLLMYAFAVNNALEKKPRETVKALQKYVKPTERCDPRRVQIELIVISFIRNPKFGGLAQKMGGVLSPSSGPRGSEVGKIVCEEIEEGVKDMCKDVASEATSEVGKVMMESLPGLLFA
eukprot:Skav202632  [mRNA]  locus=scaffold1259:30954:31941:+ [translate_table: standard]